jgi:hypothetical protein
MRSMRTISTRIAMATVAAAMATMATVGVSAAQVVNPTIQQATVASTIATTRSSVGTLDPAFRQGHGFSLAVPTPVNGKMTRFNPLQHGFQFRNDFVTELRLADVQNLRWGGLCGGMSYAALDYFYTGKPIPRQDTVPATGSPLFNYLYNRQVTSLEENVDKWLELVVNPFGWRTSEFFNWGLQGFNGGRLQELREQIDAGRPVPLGLFKAGNGGAGPHHQVVAVGYDLGRYAGDLGNFKEDLKIFIYDPNHPNQFVTLVPSVASQSYHYLEYANESWMTYFVDRKYQVNTPPSLPDNPGFILGLATQLILSIGTGGDDLRGGNDNVNATIYFKSYPPVVVPNLNNGARWIDHYTEHVLIPLNPPVTPDQITGVLLTTTFGGGIGGDNWNIDSLQVRAGRAADNKVLYQAAGNPLVRLTGDNKSFLSRIDPVFDGGFEAQTSRSLSAPWVSEGPDWKGVDINLGQSQSGRNNAFTWSTGRNWNAILQAVPVTPNTDYVLSGWVRTSGQVNAGFFGARLPGQWPPRERQFGYMGADYQRIEVRFNSSNNSSITIFGGLWGVGTPGEWLQMDNVSLQRA